MPNSEIRKVESPDQMTSEYRDMVKQLLESQAYRELMAAHVFGHALRYVPGLKYKLMIASHIKEELEHYEETVKLYAELGGDVEDRIGARLNNISYPESWFELAMIQFLYDRAGEFHLSEYKNCSYAPYARIVGKILEEEEGHEGFGESVLTDMVKHNPDNQQLAQELFNKWLPIALLSFGRPGTAGNKYCIDVGLKTRDSGEVMQDFIDDIKPTMVACGISFPPEDQIGIAMPDDIDLSLPES